MSTHFELKLKICKALGSGDSDSLYACVNLCPKMEEADFASQDNL